MDRRRFAGLVCAVAVTAGWPVPARPQPAGVRYRVGLLSGAARGAGDERLRALVAALAAQGFDGGRTLELLERAVDPVPDGLRSSPPSRARSACRS